MSGVGQRAARPAKKAAGKAAGRSWREASPAEVVVISGPESVLADRAVARITAALTAADPELTVSRLDAAGYEAAALAAVASPSLFGERRLVVLSGLAEANEAAVGDVLAYLGAPDESVTLILIHAGGPRAKKVVDTAVAGGAQLIEVPALKRDDERLAFVGAEFQDAGRRIATAAAQALVDAFGSDLRELASCCAQLIADVPGDVDETHVRRYYGGRAEATGFEVADAIAAKDTAAALLATRRAVDSGVDPIPLVAAIAARLRTMAKVAAVGGSGGAVAAELGMAPWLVDKARRELRAWSPDQLGDAIIALADADVALKGGLVIGGVPRGGSVDNMFTLERMVLRMIG